MVSAYIYYNAESGFQCQQTMLTLQSKDSFVSETLLTQQRQLLKCKKCTLFCLMELSGRNQAQACEDYFFQYLRMFI